MSTRQDLEWLAYWTAATAAAVAVPVAYFAFARRQRNVYEADFGNFLKSRRLAADDCPDDDDPTNFKRHETATTSSEELRASEVSEEASPELSQAAENNGINQAIVEVLVMYGTEYGFSKEVAEKAARELAVAPYRPKLVDMSDYPVGYPLGQEQVVLIVCSTQGDGVPPNEARPFVEWMEVGCPSMPAGVHFSVLALGDRSYTHFAACGKRIDTALEKLQAHRFYPRVDVHMEDWTAINGWIKGVSAALPELCLRPTSRIRDAPYGSSEHENGVLMQEPKKQHQKRFTKSDPFMATVVRVNGLCNIVEPGDKNTVQVELDLDDAGSSGGITYTPGDALGVIPLNPENAVAEILKALKVDGTTPVQTLSRHHMLQDGEEMPIAEALRVCYDLRSPKPSLLSELLAHIPTANPDARAGEEAFRQLRQLRRLIAEEEEDCHQQASSLIRSSREQQGPVEAYMSSRHVIDILQDFSASKLPIDRLLRCLRPLQPRLYSISSSPLEAPGRVQLTVAVVRYDSLGKERVGVASTFLGERIKAGDRVAVYVSENPDFRLPENPATPIIMVGPGTGIAPFRSFIQHRLLTATTAAAAAAAAEDEPSDDTVAVVPPAPAMMLCYGCRSSNRDFLYSDWLETLRDTGAISLYTAFSREGPNKVYVQDRLRKASETVWALLEDGAHFYICGDASRMAGDVEDALLGIIASRNSGGIKAALRYLKDMKEAGRSHR